MCVCTYIHISMYIYIYIHTYTHMCVYVCVYIYIYVYIHIIYRSRLFMTFPHLFGAKDRHVHDLSQRWPDGHG